MKWWQIVLRIEVSYKLMAGQLCIILSLGGAGAREREILHILHVLRGFNDVLKLFPYMFPITTFLYPNLFGHRQLPSLDFNCGFIERLHKLNCLPIQLWMVQLLSISINFSIWWYIRFISIKVEGHFRQGSKVQGPMK